MRGAGRGAPCRVAELLGVPDEVCDRCRASGAPPDIQMVTSGNVRLLFALCLRCARSERAQ